jgi:amidase
MAADPFASASSLAAALRARQISAAELLDLQLRRIARFNPVLNAIAIPTEEEARGRAAAADRAAARGDWLGPLHGLPITIKDCIDTVGVPTTAGVPARAHAPAITSAPAARRLLDAGAVLLGKTNVATNAGDWQAENALFGRSNNPWDLSRTPGGSTGGGAAALAAGLTALELGSDIGGSIRVPAAFCGLYGHRPSDTAVPRYGYVPGWPSYNPAMVLNVLGPLARSAADLDLSLGVIAGPVVGEDVAWRLMMPPAREENLSAFRVAVLPMVGWLPVDDEIHTALDDVVALLRGLGARVAEATPDGFDLYEHEALYTSLLGLMELTTRGLSEEERRDMVEDARRSSNPFGPAHAVGLTASAATLLSLLDARERCREGFRDFFRQWDVLLAPVTLTPAFEHIPEAVPLDERTLRIDGVAVPYERMTVFPGVATLPGLPATAFPCGRTRGGLPIGLQAIGPYLEDRTPIRFAQLLEREMGGFVAPEGYLG